MQSRPIEVFYWSTPNGRKVTVMLEELAVPYTVTFIDLGKREQWTPEFERVSPNHQIPAIVDPEGPGGQPISVFESGAILLYLGRKFGRFYPQDDERARSAVETWLMWQMGSFGPLLGQAHHFNLAAAEDVPYAIERYSAIARRLYAVLEASLGGRLMSRSRRSPLPTSPSIAGSPATSGTASGSPTIPGWRLGSRGSAIDRRSSAEWP